MFNFVSALASVLLLLGCKGTSVQAQPQDPSHRKVFVSYYDIAEAKMRQYEVPRFAITESYTSEIEAGNQIVAVRFANDLPAGSKDPFMVEIYFGHQPGQYEKCLVAVIGPVAYPSMPPVKQGRAAIIDLQSGKVLAWGRMQTKNGLLRTSVSQEALRGAPIRIAITRYAPARLLPNRIDLGSEAVAEILFRHEQDARLMTAIPSHPGNF